MKKDFYMLFKNQMPAAAHSIENNIYIDEAFQNRKLTFKEYMEIKEYVNQVPKEELRFDYKFAYRYSQVEKKWIFKENIVG